MAQEKMEFAEVSFGAWVRQRRRILDLTQAALASHIGISRSFLRKIEADERRPSREVAALLADELAVAPDERTRFLQVARGERLVANLGTAVADNIPKTRSKTTLTLPPLPTPTTTFIGRRAELATVGTLLTQPDVRLLTLIGPGGIGKTRLSLALARGTQSDFKDGVCFVELAAIRDPELVMSAVAQKLALRESGTPDILQRVAESLQDRQILLVLDNFEQVMAAATAVAKLLAAVPTLKIIVTSRELLRISGEHLFWVPPLALPTIDLSLDALLAVEAVALFIARAKQVQPELTLDQQNRQVIIEICARLDGLPLALELAASRVRHMSLTQLLLRLQTHLPVLSGGPRDAPARQQTIAATVAWSFDLLTSAEKTLFASLGLFIGGFSATAVEQICQLEQPDMVLDTLAALVDKSLVQQGMSNGRIRYHQFETIREFATTQVESTGQKTNLQKRHATYFLHFAEEAAPQLHFAEQVTWLTRLQNDHANFQQALSWFIAHDQATEALRLIAALGWYWSVRGHSMEGYRWLQAALALDADIPPAIHAAALNNAAGRLSHDLHLTTTGRILTQEALALARMAQDRRQEAWALGWSALYSVQLQEDLLAVQRHIQEANAIFTESGDSRGMAWSLTALGVITMRMGELTESKQYHQESLTLSQSSGNLWGISQAAQNLGLALYELGEIERAADLFLQTLSLYDEITHFDGLGNALCGLSLVAAKFGFSEDALGLLSVVQAQLTVHYSWLGYPEQVYYQQLLAQLQSQLAPDLFAVTWQKGQQMTFTEAIKMVHQFSFLHHLTTDAQEMNE